MSHTAERIRMVQLFQSLGGNGESPGAITLRALEIVERLRKANDKLGSWMSAALDDPNVCAEMKTDIAEWFAANDAIDR